jgi:hypothetical protein
MRVSGQQKAVEQDRQLAHCETLGVKSEHFDNSENSSGHNFILLQIKAGC